MVTAVAAPIPNIPAVPVSKAATSAESAQGSQAQFKDIYQSVPEQPNPQDDSGPKAKGSGRLFGGKKSPSDGSDKVAAPVMPTPNGVFLPKAPLTAFPLLGLPAQVTNPEESPDGAESAPTDGGRGGGSGANNSSLLQQNGGPVLAAANGIPIPRIDTHAFSVRLIQSDSPPSQPQGAPQRPQLTNQPPAQIPNQAARDARTATPPANAAPVREADRVEAVKKVSSPEASLPLRDFSSAPTPELRQSTLASEPSLSEASQTAAANAIHDIQAIAPEAPKTSASSEILLHIAGQDQSSAAIRISDRAGTVNVSVHATDSELRSSLRSNLGELTSQLNAQGIKTAEIKPAVMAAQADNSKDTPHDGQRSSGQQYQSSHSDRQPQRDRRANPNRWLEDLEQETSGSAGTPGGTNR